MHDFVKKVKTFISDHKMIDFGEKVLVGVSGGPDSLSLLYALFYLQRELNFKIHIAHLDHKFRGVESAADAEFVRQHANKLRIEATIEAIDIPGIIRQNKISPEACAREIRYEFYERIASEVDATKVALGHNADDQAETILMRLLRGSGSHGLSGIPKVRDGKYIRPLLSCYRSEIENFLSDLQLLPRQDSSNRKSIYLRNKIRLELLPLLESEYNPTIKDVLFRTAEILLSESEILNKIAKENLSNCVINRCWGSVEIDIGNFQKRHVALQRRILRLCIADVLGNVFDLRFEHIESILNTISNSKPNISLILPHQLEVIKAYDKLIIRKSKPDNELPNFEYKINVPGITELPSLKSVMVAELYDNFAITADNKFQEVFDWEKIKQPLLLRKRRPGDRFQPLGMCGRRKLKDFFIDIKVPKKLRDQIPILVCKATPLRSFGSDEIVWVVGYRISDKFKVTDSTNRKLVLTYK